MSAFDSFKVGDRVAHVSMGDGVVTAVDDCIHVVFDGRGAKGAYDRNWFRIHAGYLFHRNTGQETES